MTETNGNENTRLDHIEKALELSRQRLVEGSGGQLDQDLNTTI
jgi:hypothetical protein